MHDSLMIRKLAAYVAVDDLKFDTFSGVVGAYLCDNLRRSAAFRKLAENAVFRRSLRRSLREVKF